MVDISGAEMLAREARRRRAMGGGLYFYFMKDAVRDLLRKGGYLKDIGEENVFDARDDVIGDALSRGSTPRSAATARRASFRQCNVALPNGEPRRDTAPPRPAVTVPLRVSPWQRPRDA